jgi:hypothetical protein
MRHEEWSLGWPDEGSCIPCLNDTLNGTIYVTTRSHSLETPSGAGHWIESFFGTGYAYSKISANTWTVNFNDPINGNLRIGKGGRYKLQQMPNYAPDDGDGRLGAHHRGCARVR